MKKFIKGKWYFAQGYYLKFSYEDKGFSFTRNYGETIDKYGNYLKIDYWSAPDLEREALENDPLTDLSAIQKWLPEGHIDKISEKIIPNKRLTKLLQELNIN